jgi:hypothetical protein
LPGRPSRTTRPSCSLSSIPTSSDALDHHPAGAAVDLPRPQAHEAPSLRPPPRFHRPLMARRRETGQPFRHKTKTSGNLLTFAAALTTLRGALGLKFPPSPIVRAGSVWPGTPSKPTAPDQNSYQWAPTRGTPARRHKRRPPCPPHRCAPACRPPRTFRTTGTRRVAPPARQRRPILCQRRTTIPRPMTRIS